MDKATKNRLSENYKSIFGYDYYAPKQKTNKKAKKKPVTKYVVLKASDGKGGVSPTEERLSLFFNEMQVKYIRQYHVGIVSGSVKNEFYFDFYLPEYNLVIEFDGLHHYKPIYGDAQYQKTRLNDKKKDEWCKNKKCKILRIPYYNSSNVENVITEYLDKHFPTT